VNRAGIATVGLILAVIGGIAVAWQSNNHAACNSVFIQALSNGGCGKANFIWGSGVVVLVIGVAFILAGAILGRRTGGPR
jgi:hypothetical protein